MATKEEIIQKYQEDRDRKLLELQTTLSSRIAQEAKQSAAVINGVSIISTTSVADDIFKKERILQYQNGKDTKFVTDLRKEFVSKNSTIGEPFAYLSLFPVVLSKSDEEVVVTVSQVLFFIDPSGKEENIESLRSNPNKIEVSSFGELKKELSALGFPFSLSFVSNRYENYLKLINDKLKSINIFSPIDSFPILVHSQINIPDGTSTSQFTKVFPKPDGLELSVTPPPLPETPTVPGTTTLPETPSVPGLPGGTSVPSVPEIPTETPTNINGQKYTSVEAVKKDDPKVEGDSDEVSVVISDRFISDEDIGKSFKDSKLEQIKTQEVVNKSDTPPATPIGDKNKEVVKNEKEESERRTETQKILEDSDSLEKEKIKEKSATGASGPNPGLIDGKEAKKDENSDPIPQDKKPEPVPDKNSNAKSFSSWAKSDGKAPDSQTSNFIYYRGTDRIEYPKPPVSALSGDGKLLVPQKTKEKDIDPNRLSIPSPPLSKGVELKYKSLFNFGKNLSSIFKGYSPKSPVDVALLMNTEQVGQFNKNWPYLFGEGSEIHLAITRASNVANMEEGGFGTYRLADTESAADINWASNPHWCGFCTNFMLGSNGQYKSDDEIKDIINTGRADEYYIKNPFNVIKGKDNINKIQGKYAKDISSKQSSIKSKKESISSKEKKLANERKKADRKKQRELQNTPPTELENNPVLEKKIEGFYVTVRGIEAEISQLNSDIQKLNEELEKIKSDRDTELKNVEGDEFKSDGDVALFYLGTHWDSTGMLPKGIDLWERIKLWSGAYIVKRKKGKQGGHVETLLHITKNGKLYTIGGNTDLDGANANGSHYGFKFYGGIDLYCGSAESFYVVKRGSLNPYTNGIGISVKKTDLYDKYVKELTSDKTLSTDAYNRILRNIMEV